MDVSLDELKTTRDGALRWLIESDVRSSNGGYRAIYKPRSEAYEDWYDGETSLVCTAGAVLALDVAGHQELALRSAEHICELRIGGNGKWRGALRAGRGSHYVVANYVGSALLALLRAHERSGNGRFLEVAIAAGDFVIDHMQGRDGSICRELRCDTRRYGFGRRFLPQQTWSAHCIEGLFRLWEVTGHMRYRVSAGRAADWLVRLQRPDGSLPLEVPSRLTRLGTALGRGGRRGAIVSSRTHPAIQTYAIKAFMVLNRLAEARRTAEWLSQRLGANGLCHQFYFADGRRSAEEDVMPTAHFGLLSLEYPELGVVPGLVMTMANGICSARIDASDRNARGALRGLPLHPERGDHAYCWDTAFALLFLQGLLERSRRASDPA